MKDTDSFSQIAIWTTIKEELGMSKLKFGKKINFISDKFIREKIFRDIGQAYFLAKNDFSKPAVILAGGVIEELLRQYLNFKNIIYKKNSNFKDYIELCKDKVFFKSAISNLSHSVREFRNLVHIKNEINPKNTISKVTGIGAVSSIFTIANDF
jgi:hypothetical protein